MNNDLKEVDRPFPAFRFEVTFIRDDLRTKDPKPVVLGKGAFSECTGLEATMEPKTIEEGGLNYGAHQRVGRVSFSTVILKRGVTYNRDLWFWFQNTQLSYAHRLSVKITLFDQSGTAQWAWQLKRCMPVKFKSADMNSTSAEVAVEELHLVHEGLTSEPIAQAEKNRSSEAKA